MLMRVAEVRWSEWVRERTACILPGWRLGKGVTKGESRYGQHKLAEVNGQHGGEGVSVCVCRKGGMIEAGCARACTGTGMRRGQ
jgi:hypothetical protein